jgi:hypothetical protein
MVVEFAGESAAHRYLVDYKGEACMRPVAGGKSGKRAAPAW